MPFYNPTNTNTYSTWTNSAATGTTGKYANWQSATADTASQFTVPMKQPDPAAVRRHEKEIRLREWLEKWRVKREQRESETRKKEEAEASERARSLLLEYLDERNRQNLMDKKPLEVMSELHQGVMYQIPHQDGRIKALRGDRVVSELCLQVKASEWLPSEDKLLSKLLYLRNDEAGALRIANHFNVTEDLMEGLN